MSFWHRLVPVASVAMFLIAAAGCSPGDPSPQDEEKEPHFVLGNSRFNTLEFDGAIEAFQESLEINPHSAQAHYRLAQIYDTKRPDPAAAIYHYNEYLRLDPHAENAEVIRQRILTCKQQLVQDVMTMPTAPQTLRQVENLTETNRLLLLQVDRLNDAVKQWSAYAASLQAAAKNNPTPQYNNYSAPAAGSLTPDDESAPSRSSTTATAPPRHVTATARPPAAISTHARTHVVAAGETMAAIARKQGISLTSLQAANPGVTPKKLRVGQTLNLP
ncbi:MAG TPA: LysM peptidoglycan-binding domain-containing protein [Verrucomicrobiae bacterium]|nr:LysM peptidoglycan-binding domain-containing protein [Verrucomicrobiae bacterium]